MNGSQTHLHILCELRWFLIWMIVILVNGRYFLSQQILEPKSKSLYPQTGQRSMHIIGFDNKSQCRVHINHMYKLFRGIVKEKISVSLHTLNSVDKWWCLVFLFTLIYISFCSNFNLSVQWDAKKPDTFQVSSSVPQYFLRLLVESLFFFFFHYTKHSSV